MLASRIPADGASQGHTTPVQGADLHQGLQSTPRSNALDPIDTAVDSSQTTSSPSSLSSPNPYLVSSSASVRAGDHRLSFEISSPTKQRSPLRHSISYTDAQQHDFSSFIDSSSYDYPTLSSPTMAYTGDRKSSPMGSKTRAQRPTRLSRGSSFASDGGSDAYTSSTETLPRQRISSQHSQTSSPQLASSPSSSRFSFFTSPISAFKSLASSPVTTLHDVDTENDELMFLDIESALFPSAQPSERDTFSPAAFKNLQMNATGLLRKYQAAYQSRTIHLRELKADGRTQLDEKVELETKAHHLKIQLEEMSRKATEQESVMQALMEELNREKKLRADEQAAREKNAMSSQCSTVSEDLGVDEDQRTKWRKSGETSKSDLSFDTDGESIEEASVFSRSRSPTVVTNVSEVTPVELPSSQAKPVTLGPPRAPRPSQPPMTTLQKLFKGVSGDVSKDDRGVNGCRNCQGQDASMAWDTVSLLRDENKGLKERVSDLETTVEGALDVINGFGIEV